MNENIEPSIEEQLGIAESQSLTRTDIERAALSNKRRHERPGLFNTNMLTVAGYEIWLTPYNRFFLVDSQTGQAGYPHLLATGIIYFEPNLGNVPKKVLAKLEALLLRQKAIKRHMIEQGEYDDGEAWNWL
jgi:hypothetical protein